MKKYKTIISMTAKNLSLFTSYSFFIYSIRLKFSIAIFRFCLENRNVYLLFYPLSLFTNVFDKQKKVEKVSHFDNFWLSFSREKWVVKGSGINCRFASRNEALIYKNGAREKKEEEKNKQGETTLCVLDTVVSRALASSAGFRDCAR